MGYLPGIGQTIPVQIHIWQMGTEIESGFQVIGNAIMVIEQGLIIDRTGFNGSLMVDRTGFIQHLLTVLSNRYSTADPKYLVWPHFPARSTSPASATDF